MHLASAKGEHMGLIAYDFLETLRRCGGYYACPKDGSGKRKGPLVGYAGRYDAGDGKQKQYVGEIYANFARAECQTKVLEHFALCLSEELDEKIDYQRGHVFCGMPIGGYSLADFLGAIQRGNVIKMEKKITALKTETSREVSQLVLSRHEVLPEQRVVLVEDVVNNFSTTKEAVGVIHKAGGQVIAIACFLNRSLEVGSVYTVTLDPYKPALEIPVISLVRKKIQEWKQDDPAVADDVASGNVIWKPKDQWDLLMEAMSPK